VAEHVRWNDAKKKKREGSRHANMRK